jgi:ACR3 family arsenite transporter
LPLTVLPVFWLMPVLGSVEQILGATGRLMLTILLAGGGALLTRRLVLTRPSPRLLMRLDGVSVLALAIFVIALMASVAESITQTPVSFAFWLAVAVTANFGLQFAMLQFGRNPVNGARALVAGNRNLSLFFVALPPVLTDPLLVFLGCYQLPMLLTPILLARAYRQ